MASHAGEDDIIMPVSPRVGHIAVAANDFMIVWGGYKEDSISYNERYLQTKSITVYHTDLDVGYWTRHDTDGDVPPGTSGAVSALCEGKMYVFGGHTEEGNTNDLYCLDLRELKWKQIKPCNEQPSPRDKFAAWCYDNKLYCFGGFGEDVTDGNFLKENGKFVRDTTPNSQSDRCWNNQLVVYNIQNKMWSNPICKGTSPLPRAAHAAVRLKNFVYIFGGRHRNTRMNDLHCLELETLTWSGELYVEGACPCGRSWHSFTAVSDDVAFLYGGYSNDSVPLSDAWQLNVSCRQWSQITVAPDRPRLWHTCCSTSQGDILVFGGCENDILKWDEPNVQSNEVLTFQLHPYKLQRLCLHAVYLEHSSERWCMLPKQLQDWLQKKRNLETRKTSDSPEEPKLRQGSTCAIS